KGQAIWQLSVHASREASAEEEYIRKADIRLAVFICLGYISTFRNWSIASYAKIETMEKQRNMYKTQYNTLYIVFQFPFNLLFRKVGVSYVPILRGSQRM
ncbi:hypothetical protein DL89DRAFT_269983, partial [Linderina pennispora]